MYKQNQNGNDGSNGNGASGANDGSGGNGSDGGSSGNGSNGDTGASGNNGNRFHNMFVVDDPDQVVLQAIEAIAVEGTR